MKYRLLVMRTKYEEQSDKYTYNYKNAKQDIGKYIEKKSLGGLNGELKQWMQSEKNVKSII